MNNMKTTNLIIVAIFSALAFLIPAFTQESVIVDSSGVETDCYEVVSTQNMWTFLRLDNRTGEVIQASISLETLNSTVPLVASVPLGSKPARVGRFQLTPTQNMYNFVLLDKDTGNMVQVQWNHEENKRLANWITPKQEE